MCELCYRLLFFVTIEPKAFFPFVFVVSSIVSAYMSRDFALCCGTINPCHSLIYTQPLTFFLQQRATTLVLLSSFVFYPCFFYLLYSLSLSLSLSESLFFSFLSLFFFFFFLGGGVLYFLLLLLNEPHKEIDTMKRVCKKYFDFGI